MVHHKSTCDGVTVARTSLSLTVNKDPIYRNGRWDTRQPQPRTTVWQSAGEDASLFRNNPEDYIYVWPRGNTHPGAPRRQSSVQRTQQVASRNRAGRTSGPTPIPAPRNREQTQVGTQGRQEINSSCFARTQVPPSPLLMDLFARLRRSNIEVHGQRATLRRPIPSDSLVRHLRDYDRHNPVVNTARAVSTRGCGQEMENRQEPTDTPNNCSCGNPNCEW